LKGLLISTAQSAINQVAISLPSMLDTNINISSHILSAFLVKISSLSPIHSVPIDA